MPRSPSPIRGLPLAILICASAAGPLALNILVPSMPGMQAVFGVDYSAIQLTLTFYLIAFAVAQLAYGPLSDRFGRRPVLISGLCLFVIGSGICLVAPTLEVLVGGRVVQAMGGCAGYVMARAIVRDLYERDQVASMIAYISMAHAVAPMVAPAIGGYLDVWFDWRAGFVLVLVFGVIMAAGTITGLKETNQTPQSLSSFGDLLRMFGSLLGRPLFRGYAFQVGCTTGVFFAFISGSPYVLVEILGRPASDYGLFFWSVPSMFMTGSFIAGRISPRVGINRMLIVGVSLTSVSVLILHAVAVAGVPVLSTWTLFGPMCGVALGNGLSMANGLAGAVSVDPARAGAASGLVGFLQSMLGAVASFAVGAFLVDEATPLTAVMVFFALSALAFHVVNVRLWPGPDPGR